MTDDAEDGPPPGGSAWITTGQIVDAEDGPPPGGSAESVVGQTADDKDDSQPGNAVFESLFIMMSCL